MDVTNRDQIDRQLATLQDEYGDVPIEREEPPFEAPPALFARMVDAATSGTVNRAYVWVRRTPEQFPDPAFADPERGMPTGTRVLFVYNRADDHTWTIPGGGQEPGESLETTARRELAEETGIDATITGLRKIQHKVAVPQEPEGDTAFESVHALYPVFEATYDAGALEVRPDELYGAAWFDRVPHNAHDLIADETVAPP